jgi:hypothetical protein
MGGRMTHALWCLAMVLIPAAMALGARLPGDE